MYKSTVITKLQSIVLLLRISNMPILMYDILLMLDNLKLDKPAQNYVIRKVMNIAIRCTYYIFCHCNKPWSNSDLLDFDLCNI